MAVAHQIIDISSDSFYARMGTKYLHTISKMYLLFPLTLSKNRADLADIFSLCPHKKLSSVCQMTILSGLQSPAQPSRRQVHCGNSVICIKPVNLSTLLSVESKSVFQCKCFGHKLCSATIVFWYGTQPSHSMVFIALEITEISTIFLQKRFSSSIQTKILYPFISIFTDFLPIPTQGGALCIMSTS